MRVSVCCSVLNHSAHLQEMIQTVTRQTFSDWELIVIDDGSDENISSIVASFNDPRIRFERFAENKGIPFGINRAFELAQGDYVNALAADERLAPTKFEEQVAYLDAHPEVDAVWGLPGNGPVGKRPKWEQYALKAQNRSNEAWIRTLLNLEHVPLGGASCLFRRQVLTSIGPFDTELRAFSDHEWFVRFFEKHAGMVLPYRWATCQPNPQAVSLATAQNVERNAQELDYVRAKHPQPLPPTTGMVTVGIPVYNMAGFVLHAVKSVLAQTHENLELFILDDASTDDTLEVITKYLTKHPDPRVKIMQFDENRGCLEAQNQMAFRANGEFFMLLAADDLIEATFVERCLAEFGKNPWLEFVASQTDFIDEKGRPFTAHHPFMDIPKAENRSREEWLTLLYRGNVYFGVGMYRTAAVSQLGGWNKDCGVIADYEMYLKLLQRENIRIIEEALTHTRIHGRNRSLLKAEDAKALPQLYHDAKKPYYQPRMKLYIATPFYEVKGYSPYIDAIVQTCKLLTQCGVQWEFMNLSGDSYVHRARNTICASFLDDPDATDLFFIDSDMAWDPEALVRLLMLPEAVVGGTYPVKNKWENWTSVPHIQEEGGKGHYVGRPLKEGMALIQAEVLAGGFLRIKREVLEKFQAFYPDLWYYDPSSDRNQPTARKYTEFFSAGVVDHTLYGEDHFFSKRMREMGQKMFIYPDVMISHWGVKEWRGNFHEHLLATKEKEAPKLRSVS